MGEADAKDRRVEAAIDGSSETPSGNRQTKNGRDRLRGRSRDRTKYRERPRNAHTYAMADRMDRMA